MVKMKRGKEMDHLNNEEKIITAAKEVFQAKGYGAARMQEIAEKAGINKALLHYYFRSKDKIYVKVFKEAIDEQVVTMQKVIQNLMMQNADMKTFIRVFIEHYIEFITKNISLPIFIITEVNQNFDMVRELMDRMNAKDKMRFLQMKIDYEVEKGTIKPIKVFHLITTMIGLCIFPIISKPILMHNFELTEAEYKELLEERKQLVPEMVWNMIKAD